MRLKTFSHHLVLAACGLLAASSQSWAATTIKVAHDFWIGYSAIFVAQEKGYYKDAGLDVELSTFPGPGDSIVPLVAGQVDIACVTLHNIALVCGQGDTKLKSIYLLDSSNGADAIVAKKEIADMKALKGKKVAATVNDVNHMLLLTALEKNGLKESDVEIVNLAGTDAGAAFLAGTIDAATTWEPFITQCVKEGNGHVVYSTKDLPETLINVVAVQEKSVETKKDDLIAFLKATAKGATYVHEHPKESYAAIAKHIDAKPEDVQGMLDVDEIFDMADNVRLTTSKDGAPSPALKTMGIVAKFVTDRKLVQKEVKPEEIIDSSLLNK